MKKDPTLRERALGLLARREYSRAELARRLGPYSGDPGELQELLEALCAKHQLSDERYAEARVHTLSKKYGAARILHELKAKGIEIGLAQSAMGDSGTTERERARIAWQKKFRSPPKDRQERARHMRFLQSRGFSFDVIRSVLDGGDED